MFQFKQFSLSQENVGAKVGTDAVLLGAWTPIPAQAKTLLDIGTGTGVIALMMAQRCGANITAVEIEPAACRTAEDNFKNSPWGERLSLFPGDFLKMSFPHSFDLIISNPPFYADAFRSKSEKRNLARNEQVLPFYKLLRSVKTLLSTEGVFSVVVPLSQEKSFLSIAEEHLLFPFSILRTRGNSNAEYKRSFISFSGTKKECNRQQLTIEEKRHVYTPEYIAIVKNFYLKM